MPAAGVIQAAPLPGAPAVGRLISSGSVPLGGFAPGTVLAGRYRIIGLLGRGGMGEVYRADDLKLGQPVALKFLPNELAEDPVRRERLFAEVRIARQVSHPNICRVYDIGEMEGRHFLTMEYVDGEDLASLLKRIGSLHGAKALDIGRQLCAGLAAAHDRGVLHRDLKPANVMLDGHGRVRITDFGLAAAAGEEAQLTDMSGTPAYMAPEQFAGKGASVRSDIYALGLVLYEIYTGRCAFQAATLPDLLLAKESVTPAAPSEVARDIDPIVERVILRCLEKDARQRPASVAHVAAALPGGDPLAAAIAAGETPSPEMVAASGGSGALRPAHAWGLLACLVALLVTLALGSPRRFAIGLMPVEKSPEVLSERARELLIRLGQTGAPYDSVWGFVPNPEYDAWVFAHDQSTARWDRLPASSTKFWYRQSARSVVGNSFLGHQDHLDPAPYLAGDAVTVFDTRGRLMDLDAMPPQVDATSGPAPAPDWAPLFAAADLDPAAYRTADPTRTPLMFADARAAWTGPHPDLAGVVVRIEAAAYRGRPVAWHLIAPWDKADRMPGEQLSSPGSALNLFALGLASVVLAGALFVARRNLRTGRGDRRGAVRLAWGAGWIVLLSWLVEDHHFADLAELYVFLMHVCLALALAVCVWVLYVALEPAVRRRWPQVLLGWSRLLSGEVRDPLVGRDLLVGCVVGASWLPLQTLMRVAARAAGFPTSAPIPVQVPFGMGVMSVAGLAADSVAWATTSCLALTFLLFLIRIALKRQWAANTAFLLVGSVMALLGPFAVNRFEPAAILLLWVMWVIVLMRFGLLAFVASAVPTALLTALPATTNLSAWYAGPSAVAMLLVFLVGAYGFVTSLGDQSVFGWLSMEE